MSDIKRVGVLGCGLMGSGDRAGRSDRGLRHDRSATCPRSCSIAAAPGIEKSLAKFVEKGKLPAADRDADAEAADASPRAWRI